MYKTTILILGGTAEAIKLASLLQAPDRRVISSLAGRTLAPAPIQGEVRVGGFGGAQGLAKYLKNESVDLLIDATHPFATQISDNAIFAATEISTAFVRLERPAWVKKPGDKWISVDTLAQAAEAIPPKARVLLALGKQHISSFSKRNRVHFVVRMIDPPEVPLELVDFELELSKPGTTESETNFLIAKRISHVVCRNSGGKASYAKVKAARELGIPVIMIERPHRPTIRTLPDVESIVIFTEKTLSYSEPARNE
ncbi:cobalt-precorrin-6A reductase [Phyllobacterium sp. YR531]|uniref:cobalt-precorrin-6A reductase n=1 Tax=Phyllobacterium sp. YR531 TaxID=1144343 RepID=UPI00026F753B|nr:cobalt-precorrin-6A reductase [Phyllobacterium sp. YR531]EJN03947.1 precorrin-6x reductase [Phyllobacterium sp. YR531]